MQYIIVIFKFIISVTGGYCDYSPRDSKNLPTPLGRRGRGAQKFLFKLLITFYGSS